MPPLVDFRIRQTTKENIGDISALAAWHTTARYLNPCTRNLSVSLALALFTAHLLFFKTYRHTTVTWEWHKHGHARITLGFWEMSHLPTNQDLILFLRKKNCIKCKFLESPSRIKTNSNKRKKKPVEVDIFLAANWSVKCKAFAAIYSKWGIEFDRYPIQHTWILHLLCCFSLRMQSFV